MLSVVNTTNVLSPYWEEYMKNLQAGFREDMLVPEPKVDFGQSINMWNDNNVT